MLLCNSLPIEGACTCYEYNLILFCFQSLSTNITIWNNWVLQSTGGVTAQLKTVGLAWLEY